MCAPMRRVSIPVAIPSSPNLDLDTAIDNGRLGSLRGEALTSVSLFRRHCDGFSLSSGQG
jgi:hypothetical protein